jgi:integrase
MNDGKRRLPKFPYTVRLPARSGTVVMYHQLHGPRQQYHQFRICYDLRGQRKRETFSTFDKALRRAEEAITRICNGDLDLQSMSNEDAQLLNRIVQNAPGLETPLDQFVAEAFAAKKYCAGVSLIEVAQSWQRQNRGIGSRTIGETIKELLEQKEKMGRSKVYLDDLRLRLGKLDAYFIRNFSGAPAQSQPMTALNEETIQAFLGEQKTGPRSYNNLLRNIGTLCSFAKGRRYLPRDFDELKRVDKARQPKERISIYAPNEMANLLTWSGPLETLFIATAAFAGLRTSEFMRLDWSDYKWLSTPPHIEIPADKAKTRTRRIVPMQPNLVKWIQPGAKAAGRLWPHSQAYLYERMQAICAKANVKWKPNALRHSFISYRCAQTQEVNKVADEAGNSPQIISSNYREHVGIEAATSWFNVEPLQTGQQLAFVKFV